MNIEEHLKQLKDDKESLLELALTLRRFCQKRVDQDETLDYLEKYLLSKFDPSFLSFKQNVVDKSLDIEDDEVFKKTKVIASKDCMFIIDSDSYRLISSKDGIYTLEGTNEHKTLVVSRKELVGLKRVYNPNYEATVK